MKISVSVVPRSINYLPLGTFGHTAVIDFSMFAFAKLDHFLQLFPDSQRTLHNETFLKDNYVIVFVFCKYKGKKLFNEISSDPLRSLKIP